MRKIIALAAAGSALASAAPVFAQDVQSTFTGPRVEAIIGYDVSRSGSSVAILYLLKIFDTAALKSRCPFSPGPSAKITSPTASFGRKSSPSSVTSRAMI